MTQTASIAASQTVCMGFRLNKIDEALWFGASPHFKPPYKVTAFVNPIPPRVT